MTPGPVTAVEPMIDLDAYLARIGLDPASHPSWQAIHRAQVMAIPFENLDAHGGRPVSLVQADLEDKLVHRRRGGYCFEHNLLLGAALQRLGLEVEAMLGRSRSGSPPPGGRPATHVLLRVTDQTGCRWHADAGFGPGTLLEPIPFGPGGEHEQDGWRYRVVADDDELVLQVAGSGGFVDLYGFVPTPVPRVDLEVGNWWVCTSPRSAFVSGLIVGVSHGDGAREVLSDWSGSLRRIVRTPAGSTETAEAPARLPALLADRFGLPGFEIGADGRIVAAGT